MKCKFFVITVLPRLLLFRKGQVGNIPFLRGAETYLHPHASVFEIVWQELDVEIRSKSFECILLWPAKNLSCLRHRYLTDTWSDTDKVFLPPFSLFLLLSFRKPSIPLSSLPTTSVISILIISSL